MSKHFSDLTENAANKASDGAKIFDDLKTINDSRSKFTPRKQETLSRKINKKLTQQAQLNQLVQDMLSSSFTATSPKVTTDNNLVQNFLGAFQTLVQANVSSDCVLVNSTVKPAELLKDADLSTNNVLLLFQDTLYFNDPQTQSCLPIKISSANEKVAIDLKTLLQTIPADKPQLAEEEDLDKINNLTQIEFKLSNMDRAKQVALGAIQTGDAVFQVASSVADLGNTASIESGALAEMGILGATNITAQKNCRLINTNIDPNSLTSFAKIGLKKDEVAVVNYENELFFIDAKRIVTKVNLANNNDTATTLITTIKELGDKGSRLANNDEITAIETITGKNLADYATRVQSGVNAAISTATITTETLAAAGEVASHAVTMLTGGLVDVSAVLRLASLSQNVTQKDETEDRKAAISKQEQKVTQLTQDLQNALFPFYEDKKDEVDRLEALVLGRAREDDKGGDRLKEDLDNIKNAKVKRGEARKFARQGDLNRQISMFTKSLSDASNIKELQAQMSENTISAILKDAAYVTLLNDDDLEKKDLTKLMTVKMQELDKKFGNKIEYAAIKETLPQLVVAVMNLSRMYRADRKQNQAENIDTAIKIATAASILVAIAGSVATFGVAAPIALAGTAAYLTKGGLLAIRSALKFQQLIQKGASTSELADFLNNPELMNLLGEINVTQELLDAKMRQSEAHSSEMEAFIGSIHEEIALYTKRIQDITQNPYFILGNLPIDTISNDSDFIATFTKVYVLNQHDLPAVISQLQEYLATQNYTAAEKEARQTYVDNILKLYQEEKLYSKEIAAQYQKQYQALIKNHEHLTTMATQLDEIKETYTTQYTQLKEQKIENNAASRLSKTQDIDQNLEKCQINFTNILKNVAENLPEIPETISLTEDQKTIQEQALGATQLLHENNKLSYPNLTASSMDFIQKAQNDQYYLALNMHENSKITNNFNELAQITQESSELKAAIDERVRLGANNNDIETKKYIFNEANMKYQVQIKPLAARINELKTSILSEIEHMKKIALDQALQDCAAKEVLFSQSCQNFKSIQETFDATVMNDVAILELSQQITKIINNNHELTTALELKLQGCETGEQLNMVYAYSKELEVSTTQFQSLIQQLQHLASQIQLQKELELEQARAAAAEQEKLRLEAEYQALAQQKVEQAKIIEPELPKPAPSVVETSIVETQVQFKDNLQKMRTATKTPDAHDIYKQLAIAFMEERITYYSDKNLPPDKQKKKQALENILAQTKDAQTLDETKLLMDAYLILLMQKLRFQNFFSTKTNIASEACIALNNQRYKNLLDTAENDPPKLSYSAMAAKAASCPAAKRLARETMENVKLEVSRLSIDRILTV